MIVPTSLITQYRQDYPHEHSTISAVENHLELVKQNPKIASLHGHVTGSAWLVNPRNGKVLLTLHAKLHRWLQLGGHIDAHDDMNIHRTALREAKEESGILQIARTHDQIFHLDIHYIPAHKNKPEHYQYDFCFLHHVTEDITAHASEESLDLKWFSLAELMQIDADPGLKKMCKKWQHAMFLADRYEKSAIFQ